MLNFKWYKFAELSNQNLYDLLRLRSEVFVVEQKCAYLDPDGNDVFAIHLLGKEKNILVAYLRLFPPKGHDAPILFGRVVTAKDSRSNGYGKQLLSQLLEYCGVQFPKNSIQCSAQLYLQKFYESYGFKAIKPPHDEDGIAHVVMKKLDTPQY